MAYGVCACVLTMHFYCYQAVWKQLKKVLSVCDTLIKLGDEGPYAGLIEELRDLIGCLKSKLLSGGRARSHAPSLKKLLKGVLKRIERGAAKKLSGLAQVVDTELSGSGGCQAYKRIDAQLAALGKSTFKNEFPITPFKNEYPSNAYQSNAYQSNAYQNNAYQSNAYQNNALRGGHVGFRGGRNRGAPGPRRGGDRGRDAQGNIICYGCNQSGHIRSQCPDRNANAGGDA